MNTDMRFQADTLIRLLAQKKPIVGANVRARNPPAHLHGHQGANRRHVKTLEVSTGLEAVDYMGLAVTLIETKVFRAVPKPWFNFAYEGGGYTWEDCFFVPQGA
jgi:hypothetical protein